MTQRKLILEGYSSPKISGQVKESNLIVALALVNYSQH